MKTKHVLIVGLGVTGYACCEFLSQFNIQISVTDSRSLPPKLSLLKKNYPDITCYMGGFVIPQKVDTVVISPGVNLHQAPFNKINTKQISMIGDIELFALYANAPIVGITGTNGKSTVTTMVGEMAVAMGLNVGIGGNLGEAAISLIKPGRDLYILELSSFQLETIQSLPLKVGTILNISPDHLDRHISMDSYRNAKMRIYQQAQTIVFNRSDCLTTPCLAPDAKSRVVSFGLDKPRILSDWGVDIDETGDEILSFENRKIGFVKDLQLSGRQNVENALAAMAIGKALQFDETVMLAVVKKFNGLAHRCEVVGQFSQVLWVNDSKATNVGATCAAIGGLKQAITGRWIVLLGGDSKGADLSDLVSVVKSNCRLAIVFGQAKHQLWDLLHEHISCKRVDNLQQAVQAAFAAVTPGEGVLLSPACASFDQFTNYQARGDQFKQLIYQQLNNHA